MTSKGLEALEDIYNSLINDIEQEEDEFYIIKKALGSK